MLMNDTHTAAAASCAYNAGQGPQTAAEREIAGLMLAYYRRVGNRAAWALLKRMTAASDAGCYRENLVAMARAALDALPTRH